MWKTSSRKPLPTKNRFTAIPDSKWKGFLPRLEILEDRTVLSPIPTATIAAPSTSLINSTVSLSAMFSNTSSNPLDVGYGPFVDVELPTVGKSGAASPTNPTGLSYVPGSATYLGSPVQTTVLTFNSSGIAYNPFYRDASGNEIPIMGKAGDQLLVFVLPLGSYVPSQPASTINFTATLSSLALVNSPLQVTATGGFEFGDSAIGSNGSILGATSSTMVTPQVYLLKKTYLGPEQETATGPNFKQIYEISATVAPGQTITKFDLADLLPTNMQYVQLIGTPQANGGMLLGTSLPSTSIPGGTLQANFSQVVGTGSPTDATLEFQFYIPEFPASGAKPNPVLPPGTGTNEPVTDSATACTPGSNATYTPPTASGNPVITQANLLETASDTITAKQLATQKTITAYTPNGVKTTSPVPGDILQYQINFQVSDFFALNALMSTDTISDGQSFYTSFTPTLTYNQALQTTNPLTGSFTQGTTYTLASTTNPTTGQSTIATFNVSGLLQSLGGTGNILGATVMNSATNPSPGTTGTITFETIIDQNFSDNAPFNGAAVVQGDIFNDSVVMQGNVLNNSTLMPIPGSTATDGSSASIQISQGILTKSVYAIKAPDGTITYPSNSTTPLVAPGDDVTYELNYSLPITDIQNYQLTDFLPLPVFSVANNGNLTFETPSSQPPALGMWTYGPLDTFHTYLQTTPTVTDDPTGNSYTFNFGSANTSIPSPSSMSQVLFTVQVSNAAFADGLYLNNLVQQTQTSNTGNPIVPQQAIAPIQIAEPSLVITKGVVSTNDAGALFSKLPPYPSTVTFAAPGTTGPAFTPIAPNTALTSVALATTPINASLSNALGGDLVKFAVVIQNLGRAPDGAFNVEVNDTIPTGFEIPTTGMDLQITDGTGTNIAYTNLPGGLPAGLFGNGIELTDPSSTMGSLAAGKDSMGNLVSSGLNLAVITYDLEVEPNLEVGTRLTNTATLTNYGSTPGGPNFVPNGLTAQTTVTTAQPLVTKTITSTSLNNQDITPTQMVSVVIGETIDYQVTVTFPQNAAPIDSVNVVDTLASGLAFVKFLSFANNDPTHLTYTETPSPTDPNNPMIGSGGHSVTFVLGTVMNTATDQSTHQTLTFDYEVVALNVSSNVGANPSSNPPVSATVLKNSAEVVWNTGHTSPVSTSVTIIEPKLDTSKTVIVGGAHGNPGDPVTYTITINQDTNSQTDAYNVTFLDSLPLVSVGGASLLVNPTFTVMDTDTDPTTEVTAANFVLSGSNASGYKLATVPPTLPNPEGGAFTILKSQTDRVITITITGVLANNTKPLTTYTNSDDVEWTSLPPAPYSYTPPISTYNSNSYQRTGPASMNGGQLNNYDVQGSASFTTLPQIDLALIKTVNATKVIVGSQVTYTFVLKNNGPDTAHNVTVTDGLLIGNLTIIGSGQPSQGTFNPKTGIWTVGTLASGKTVTLKVVARVNVTGQVPNTATAKATEYDTDPNNNTSMVTVIGLFPPSAITKRMFLSR